jgi:murein L,D-transpeptidase YafK
MSGIRVIKVIKISLLALIFVFIGAKQEGFKSAQMKYPRVRAAFASKWPALQEKLEALKINASAFDLYIRIFKYEKQLEAWVKSKNTDKYTLLKTFSICASSGTLGPKRAQGDGQVPEGFYEISAFQPLSNYHLALRVSYPNKSDKVKATSKDAGGDIMIHGNCVTIGCIPIKDDPIEELYSLAIQSKNSGSTIKVHSFPTRPDRNPSIMKSENRHSGFWESLVPAYYEFEKNHIVPGISIDASGNYIVAVRS